MADVFISYKRDERAAVERIARSLRALGLDVWFDASLSAGTSFSEEIDREARTARAILVCWSPASRDSRWVRAEAMLGFEKNNIVACYVAGPDQFSPPTPFNAIHAEDLRTWLQSRENNETGWLSVLRSIGKHCDRADIESWASLGANAPSREVQRWINKYPNSPLFVAAEAMLVRIEEREAALAAVQQEARERQKSKQAKARSKRRGFADMSAFVAFVLMFVFGLTVGPGSSGAGNNPIERHSVWRMESPEGVIYEYRGASVSFEVAARSVLRNIGGQVNQHSNKFLQFTMDGRDLTLAGFGKLGVEFSGFLDYIGFDRARSVREFCSRWRNEQRGRLSPEYLIAIERPGLSLVKITSSILVGLASLLAAITGGILAVTCTQFVRKFPAALAFKIGIAVVEGVVIVGQTSIQIEDRVIRFAKEYTAEFVDSTKGDEAITQADGDYWLAVRRVADQTPGAWPLIAGIGATALGVYVGVNPLRAMPSNISGATARPYVAGLLALTPSVREGAEQALQSATADSASDIAIRRINDNQTVSGLPGQATNVALVVGFLGGMLVAAFGILRRYQRKKTTRA